MDRPEHKGARLFLTRGLVVIAWAAIFAGVSNSLTTVITVGAGVAGSGAFQVLADDGEINERLAVAGEEGDPLRARGRRVRRLGWVGAPTAPTQ